MFKKPAMQIIHRLISSLICGKKESSGNVTAGDMQILQAMQDKQNIQVAHLAAATLEKEGNALRETKVVYTGAMITRLLRRMGLLERNYTQLMITSAKWRPSPMDVKYLIKIRMIRKISRNNVAWEPRRGDKDNTIKIITEIDYSCETSQPSTEREIEEEDEEELAEKEISINTEESGECEQPRRQEMQRENTRVSANLAFGESLSNERLYNWYGHHVETSQRVREISRVLKLPEISPLPFDLMPRDASSLPETSRTTRTNTIPQWYQASNMRQGVQASASATNPMFFRRPTPVMQTTSFVRNRNPQVPNTGSLFSMNNAFRSPQGNFGFTNAAPNPGNIQNTPTFANTQSPHENTIYILKQESDFRVI